MKLDFWVTLAVFLLLDVAGRYGRRIASVPIIMGEVLPYMGICDKLLFSCVRRRPRR